MGREPTRLLFVCLGNICRSPTAEAVMRQLITANALDSRFEVDSAGIGGWHEGEPPDRRARKAAARRGVLLRGRARTITAADFDRFDLILSVDESNLDALRRLAPAGSRAELRKLAPEDVPDPYYGGADGFAAALDLIEAACTRLLDELRQD
ncbi:MAG TPA: low molecular weight protein-tyrosine-phosphatase [Jatrophihabitantaceae bacterium]|nr:low molecular weight protein-tyrosine-phosphatase [Jatrophihabitantaceae bacterium]